MKHIKLAYIRSTDQLILNIIYMLIYALHALFLWSHLQLFSVRIIETETFLTIYVCVIYSVLHSSMSLINSL